MIPVEPGYYWASPIYGSTPQPVEVRKIITVAGEDLGVFVTGSGKQFDVTQFTNWEGPISQVVKK